jgi:Domain of unknown function (DUF4926)
MDSFDLLDLVVLTEPTPVHRLRKGALGTIVEILDSETFLVEFSDANGLSYAVTALKSSVLMKVYNEPILA